MWLNLLIWGFLAFGEAILVGWCLLCLCYVLRDLWKLGKWIIGGLEDIQTRNQGHI